MADPFIAEIRIFAGNFAPREWAFCDGQLLPISQNTELFSLIGTIYGGDGHTTMALPNMQGRAPMHPGRGPGLTSRRLGQKAGAKEVTLTIGELPNHTHKVMTSLDDNDRQPIGNFPEDGYGNTSADASSAEISNAGSGLSHNNMQPFLVINYIIALQGTPPSRP